MLNKHHTNTLGNTSAELFTYTYSVENMELPVNLPQVKQILSSVVETEVMRVRVIDAMKGKSYEGQSYSGKKVAAELKLRYKVLYEAENNMQTVNVVQYETYNCCYISVPNLIEGTEPQVLMDNNILKIEVSIEDVKIKSINMSTLMSTAYMLVKLVLIPTFQVCCASYYNCKDSDIFLMHSDGSRVVKITNGIKHLNNRPLWSPKGSELAFSAGVEGRRAIFIYSLKSGSLRQISTLEVVGSIGDFCWTPDGTKLIFTAMKDNCKELFAIDTLSLKKRELTFGNGVYSSYNPACDIMNWKLAFLRSCNGMADLWICDLEGMNCRRITSCGNLQYFIWSRDGKTLAAIKRNESEPDGIVLLDTDGLEAEIKAACEGSIKKRDVRFSPDGRNLTFIGSDLTTENIYLYSFEGKHTLNISKHCISTKISDYIWREDSSSIYYAANESGCYNMYSILIGSCCRRQMTNTNAYYMELDYRPKIG